jgi:hypothetical protein
MPKSKEELLREEVHFYAALTQRYIQWGLTVMVSLETAIFFVRRDLIQSAIDAGTLAKGQELPYFRYLVGTGFLALCAIVLWKVVARSTEQYRHYKEQLVKASVSGINDKTTGGVTFWMRYVFFAFPIYDLGVRIAVSIHIHFY